MLRAYKYRMYPAKNQEEMVNKHFRAFRYVYNWGLEYKIRTYQETCKSISVSLLTKK
jgi:putative transposase